ncbi:hypothetical protein RRG08_031184 [Elysia crispata]|uniref:Uncharacterized protein n=1 Tax=Elysia crispata TaxID=231223 RepID=A0AAE0ZGB0_9GAST|nr:hypothetical protein RRG08_031184 [Elysia crispata]
MMMAFSYTLYDGFSRVRHSDIINQELAGPGVARPVWGHHWGRDSGPGVLYGGAISVSRCQSLDMSTIQCPQGPAMTYDYWDMSTTVWSAMSLCPLVPSRRLKPCPKPIILDAACSAATHPVGSSGCWGGSQTWPDLGLCGQIRSNRRGSVGQGGGRRMMAWMRGRAPHEISGVLGPSHPLQCGLAHARVKRSCSFVRSFSLSPSPGGVEETDRTGVPAEFARRPPLSDDRDLESFCLELCGQPERDTQCHSEPNLTVPGRPVNFVRTLTVGCEKFCDVKIAACYRSRPAVCMLRNSSPPPGDILWLRTCSCSLTTCFIALSCHGVPPEVYRPVTSLSRHDHLDPAVSMVTLTVMEKLVLLDTALLTRDEIGSLGFTIHQKPTLQNEPQNFGRSGLNWELTRICSHSVGRAWLHLALTPGSVLFPDRRELLSPS